MPEGPMKYSRGRIKTDAEDREMRANRLEAGVRGMAPGSRMRADTEDTANMMRRTSRLQREGLDLDNRMRDLMGGERKMKTGGMVKKVAKYQAGGPVKGPEPKNPPVGGGRKRPLTMFEQVSPEERREAGAPLSREEMRRITEGSRMKKGGMVKKKAGGMIKGGCK